MIRYFFELQKHAVDTYCNSPEGMREATEAEEHRQKLRQRMSEAMVVLKSLDFSDLSAVIGWFEEFREVFNLSNRTQVIVPREEICTTFRENGFVSIVEYLDVYDERNYARWIIDYALFNIRW